MEEKELLVLLFQLADKYGYELNKKITCSPEELTIEQIHELVKKGYKVLVEGIEGEGADLSLPYKVKGYIKSTRIDPDDEYVYMFSLDEAEFLEENKPYFDNSDYFFSEDSIVIYEGLYPYLDTENPHLPYDFKVISYTEKEKEK